MIKFIKQNPTVFYLALLTFALSLCTALQLSNLSSIYRLLGASTSYLPALWLGPPLTGLIIQPLIGQISDDTITRYGKRLPYIVGWSVLAALTSIALPFLSTLFAAVIFTLLMNCSLNGGIEALRALTGDVVNKETECSKAFALQAFFAGIGGALGAGLPYLIYKWSIYSNIKILSIAHTIPLNLKISFILSGIILLSITVLTVLKVQEKPNKHTTLLSKRVKKINLSQRIVKITSDFYFSIKKMPPRFKSICIIHSVSWAGIFIFWLYFTTALAQNFYGLPLHTVVNMNSKHSALFQSATLDSSFYFSIYQYVSIIYSGILYFFSKNHTKNIYTHAVSLLIGSIAIILFPFEKTPFTIECAMVAYGIMWGSIMVLPYAIAIRYIPRRNLGIYLGIFNICITAPQIICGLSLAFIYYYILKENASYLLSFGGFILMVSAGLWIKFIRAQSHKEFSPDKILGLKSISAS